MSYMRRNAFSLIFWLCSTVLPYAQEPPANVPVIGWLGPATTESYSQPGAGNPGPHLMHASLARHGLIDGRNVRLDMRLAEGKLDRLPGLADALVRQGAAVIVAFGEEAGRAVQAATKTIPIVCVGDDLVNAGLAASLARPGSNMTGVSILATELDAKKIEVLKELLPGAKRFGVLNDPTTSGRARPQKMAETARYVGVELQTIDIHGAGDLDAAFQALRTGGAEGVNIVASAMLNALRKRIGELSLAAKIPAVCQFRAGVEAGCLASYGITSANLYALSADQIARLLKGAKPADLPVVQPDKFELVISLKTANALGLTISPMLLGRADEVIE
jgi:putative tryptophan/tyrosine transport system substrate-binding protein